MRLAGPLPSIYPIPEWQVSRKACSLRSLGCRPQGCRPPQPRCYPCCRTRGSHTQRAISHPLYSTSHLTPTPEGRLHTSHPRPKGVLFDFTPHTHHGPGVTAPSPCCVCSSLTKTWPRASAMLNKVQGCVSWQKRVVAYSR